MKLLRIAKAVIQRIARKRAARRNRNGGSAPARGGNWHTPAQALILSYSWRFPPAEPAARAGERRAAAHLKAYRAGRAHITLTNNGSRQQRRAAHRKAAA
jgi:hypothetical protein